MDFFSSVFSAPAAAERGDEEGEERGKREGEQDEAGEGEGEAAEAEASGGGGWIFGGLIQTLKEEIEEQRREQEAIAAAAEEEAAAQRGAEPGAPAAEGQGEGDSGGGWIFGGLIKTLAEEMEAQRKVNESAAAAEEEGEREAEVPAAGGEESQEGGEGEGSGGGWSFGGLIKTLAEEIESQRKENEAAAATEEAEEGERAAAAADEGEGKGPGWSLGGLVKTFATRSETMIGGYRRDLQDLGSGLRLETAALRAAAARAAAVLPGALEAGASAASDRLESVGQAVDDLGAAAAGLLLHANEALRSAEADGEDGDGGHRASDATASGASWRASLPSKKYTRFEAQVLALRADPATFTEEPEDAEGFAKWRGSFSIDEMSKEIEGVLQESPGLESFVERLVPSVVDYETFWCRYFFAVDKLRQADDVRTKLVSRAMSKEDDEELTWEVDDDEEDEENNGGSKEGANPTTEKKEEQIGEPVNHELESSGKQEAVDENDQAEEKGVALTATKDGNGESSGEVSTPKSSDGPGREEKTEAGDSSKESDFSVVSRPSVQEEDLSWEEIEDVGDQDEKKGASPQSSSTSKMEDIRKRLNSVEDDEDLSWDVDE
ncbi:hypothetical protein ACP4OV_021100 [Aristida adscensionis]